ncbi:MAG: hypothetical protein NE334_16525 [Lentisphaeraceae bacterium]|nr:hypothetical protein [Lentisphaeraceae bacterium]
MTQDPLVGNAAGLEMLLEKLTKEKERDLSILEVKVDLLSRIAVDHLYEDACSSVISHKSAAVLGLAAHKDERAGELIIDFLGNYNLTLKRSALLSAKVLGDKSIVPHVAKCLEDSSTIVRIHAMETLESLAPELLGTLLKPLVHDPVWYVREKLAKTLVSHGQGESFLEELRHDAKMVVRVAALEENLLVS